ncbi:MAG TPA: ATP-binding cassette domain-containing protein [Clostridiales bacterium]|nr:ATP-binding cassette domain-containing protein [Clostridiales bacterium]
MADKMDKYIEIKNLSKSFDETKVLINLNLNIKKNCISCIMGPSGTGKTTLVNIMMGLIEADSGEINGINPNSIGVVFQEDRLIEHLNAVENIYVVNNKTQSRENIISQLNFLGLNKEDIEKPVKNLSGGMRRRVCIIRAILFECETIIMDEPFKGLDDSLKKKVINHLVNNRKGRTILVITHDLNEAKELNAEIIDFTR